ncbi:hypothetical protein P3W45_000358 [Vairimorpha bombi]|jgi:hypothetical protein
MTDRARRLLDNLLGTDRNILNNDTDSRSNSFCIYQMAGGCPYEMLKNTKLSLGPCKYKDHDFTNKSAETINKTLYEQELVKILSDLFSDIEKKINSGNKIQDEYIEQEEYKLDIKISSIEQNITNENISEIYDQFLALENEIYDLEKIKENFYIKNKDISMERCGVCGMSIIKNFCSKKYISHVNGRAHNGVLKLRKLYQSLINKGV